MKEEELTPTMLKAVEFAKQYGGKLHRHAGGFWMGPNFSLHGASFGTPTVEGLVKRGHAEYTEWKEGKSGRFPIVCALKGK